MKNINIALKNVLNKIWRDKHKSYSRAFVVFP